MLSELTYGDFSVSFLRNVRARLKKVICLFIQESPPAWTQEAYRPRHIKYSICYPRWGTPPIGVPPARSHSGGTWGGVPPSGYPPSQGTPQPGLMGGMQGGVPPSGYPWPGLMGVAKVEYPPVEVPPGPGLMGGTQGGVPLLRYPLAMSDGGTWGGVPPCQDTSWPGPMGGTWGGVPHRGRYPPHQGTPNQVWWRDRYQRWGTPCWGTPQLAGPGKGPPLRQVWTDKQSETITSRLVLRTRSVINHI